jgi:hypothetical protein
MSDRFDKSFTVRGAVNDQTGEITIQVLDRLGNVAAAISVQTALELSSDLSGAVAKAIKLAAEVQAKRRARVVDMNGNPL